MRKTSSFLPRREKIKKTPKKEITDNPVYIMIGGEKNIPHQVAQCCHPVFPDDIVAVLRTGGKCMVHHRECGGLTRVNPARMLPAYWHTGVK